MVASMASGVVVSRTSPGSLVLSVGSSRSSRVTSSPRARRNRVNPAGPPRVRRSRFAAVLSLTSTADAHRAPTVRLPSLACSLVTGA